MRKKNVERNYDRVARAIGKNLLTELRHPYRLPGTPAFTFETPEQIQERLEKEPLAFFWINAMGGCEFVDIERSRSFWQLWSERLDDDSKVISGTATTAWRLETGESLIVLKVLSHNVFPRRRK